MPNGTDQTKNDGMHISILSAQPCMKDVMEAKKQMKAAAIKLYKSVSAKTSAALKL